MPRRRIGQIKRKSKLKRNKWSNQMDNGRFIEIKPLIPRAIMSSAIN